jgi:hypothetical protein
MPIVTASWKKLTEPRDRGGEDYVAPRSPG